MTRSVLDGIPGVGETRRRQLVRHFGSARKAAQASLAELEQVPRVGPSLLRWSTTICTEPPGGGADDAGAADRGPPARRAVEFVVITGLSGAGRSEAAKVLEDLGYFVIDNLPPSLIGRVAELAVVGRDPTRWRWSWTPGAAPSPPTSPS